MRYVIGCSIEDKITKDKSEGICCIDRTIGLFPTLYSESIGKDDKKTYTRVYTDLVAVQKTISELAKAYRRDDVWHKGQKWLKSKKIRKFYALKIDTPKSSYTIGDVYPKNLKTTPKDYEIREIMLKNK